LSRLTGRVGFFGKLGKKTGPSPFVQGKKGSQISGGKEGGIIGDAEGMKVGVIKKKAGEMRKPENVKKGKGR